MLLSSDNNLLFLFCNFEGILVNGKVGLWGFIRNKFSVNLKHGPFLPPRVPRAPTLVSGTDIPHHRSQSAWNGLKSARRYRSKKFEIQVVDK